MTTCLWDGKTLFVDSFYDRHFMTHVRKYRIIGKNKVAFGGGHPHNLTRIWDYLETEGNEYRMIPELMDTSSGGQFTNTIIERVDDSFKIKMMINSMIEIEVPNQVITVGTGSDFIWGALEAGASTLQAMKIACKLDTGSGEPIFIINYDEEKGFYISNSLSLPVAFG